MNSITKTQRLAHFALGVFLCVSTQMVAQAGQLDNSFANKGIFAATSLLEANAVAIQKDGKIVVGGTGASNNDTLIRLNTNGTLDNSFGSGGVATFSPQTISFGFFALAIQSDGKIVAAADGALNGRQAVVQVARVNNDGSPDTSFGSGGFTSPIVFPLESGNLALQPDGKILVASGVDNPNGVPCEMARFTASGQIDTSFGGGAGVINLAYPGPTQIVVQPSGKILVAAGEPARLIFQAQPLSQPVSITRYNSNGSVDKTFGSSGTVASVASASALVLQSDGKIVIAGSLTSRLNAAGLRTNVGFGIARYSPDGDVDTTFGTRGLATVDFGANAPTSGAFAVAVQSNGDLVAAGSAGGTIFQNKIVSAFGLTRLTGAGELDATFGSKGRVITTVASGQYSWVTSLAIQSDGKILAVGTSQFNTSSSNAYV